MAGDAVMHKTRLTLADSALSLEVVTGAKTVLVHQCSATDDLSDTINCLFEETHTRSLPRRLEVLVSVPVLHVRRVTELPALNGSKLRAIVAQQPERYFRSSEALVVNATWMRANDDAPP